MKTTRPLRGRSILHEIQLGQSGPPLQPPARPKPTWSDRSLPTVPPPGGLLGTRAAGRLRVAGFTEDPTVD